MSVYACLYQKLINGTDYLSAVLQSSDDLRAPTLNFDKLNQIAPSFLIDFVTHCNKSMISPIFKKNNICAHSGASGIPPVGTTWYDAYLYSGNTWSADQVTSFDSDYCDYSSEKVAAIGLIAGLSAGAAVLVIGILCVCWRNEINLSDCCSTICSSTGSAFQSAGNFCSNIGSRVSSSMSSIWHACTERFSHENQLEQHERLNPTRDM